VAEASASSGATLKAGSLHWLHVAALGIAIAISGNVSGWNYGLAVGGWGGMLLASIAMAVLFFCLTQSLAELASALPEAGGFDGYVRRALGPTAAYLAGMSVAIALAVGAGLAMSFGEAYVSAWLGFGGWPVKLAFLAVVLGLQLRGASEAVGLTVAVGVIALVILVAFCLFMAPEFQTANLWSAVPGGVSLLPHGFGGAARCIPFALFLFLGVEQAAHAAAEMRDMQRDMPKALATAIGVAFVIGICVLLIATGGTGADRLGAVDDPLFASVTTNPGRIGEGFMVRLVGGGALVALLGTFFSLAYAGSRQFFHLAQAGFLPRIFGTVNGRQAPAPAVYLVGVIGIATAAFAPNDAMVVFIFLISVSHVLILAAFLRLRQQEPALARSYRALGGVAVAAVALLLSLSVMVSCYQLEARALQIAIAVIVLLIAQFMWLKPARLRAP
jgi:ethanolamine permease